MKLGTENKKQTMWAAILGGIAVVVLAYELIPFFMGPSAPTSSAQAAAPTSSARLSTRAGAKSGKKPKPENLDPTLRLDLLASSEQTKYEGNGRNIFVSQREVEIPVPLAGGSPDAKRAAEEADKYHLPNIPPPTPIPLKFFGFASKPGEPKKIFLQNGEDIFVAGEGEIVNRRYKVLRISPTSVEMQDVVGSGPPQNIPLTPG
ncbi:MAG: hypothetical protein WAN03_10440 [Candidatus Sulfotelmatobacter sp.]